MFQLYQICVQVMRNTFETDEDGQLLLRCVRAYVELDLLASFEVHTDNTIQHGRLVAQKFAKLADVSHLSSTRKYYITNTPG